MNVMNFRPRNLLRTVELGLFLAIELAWTFAWSVGLGFWLGGTGPLLALPIVLGLLLLATAITRGVVRQGTPRWVQIGLATLGVVVAGVIGAAMVWSAVGDGGWAALGNRWSNTTFGFQVVGAVALAVVVWWRGIAAGRSRLTLEDAEQGMRIAVIAIALAFILNSVAGGSAAPVGPLVGVTLVILFASLVNLPFARILDLGASPRHREEPALPINRHWLGLLLGIVSALLLLTLVLSLVFTFDRIDQLTRPVASLLGTVLWDLFYVIAVPIGFLVQGLIELIHALYHPGQVAPPSQPPNNDWLKNLHDQATSNGGLPPIVNTLLLGMLVVVVVAVILSLLARAIFRVADWFVRDDVDEERDFIWSWKDLTTLLAGWLRRYFRKPHIVAPWSRPSEKSVAAIGGEPRDPRALYRELLRLGARLGRRRAVSETPGEYETVLDALPTLFGEEAAIRMLTEVYTRARYGRVAPNSFEVAAARDALAVLRRATEDGEGVRESPPTGEKGGPAK